jgi:hypothetical protein
VGNRAIRAPTRRRSSSGSSDPPARRTSSATTAVVNRSWIHRAGLDDELDRVVLDGRADVHRMVGRATAGHCVEHGQNGVRDRDRLAPYRWEIRAQVRADVEIPGVASQRVEPDRVSSASSSSSSPCSAATSCMAASSRCCGRSPSLSSSAAPPSARWSLANPPTLVKRVFGELMGLLKPNPYNDKAYAELLQVLYEVFQTARKDGLVGLESHIENPETSEIFKKYPSFRTTTTPSRC